MTTQIMNQGTVIKLNSVTVKDNFKKLISTEEEWVFMKTRKRLQKRIKAGVG
jgi:hypothetical protein